MKNLKITKRDLTFLAIGSVAMMILAWFFTRRDNSSSGSTDKESSAQY